MQRKLENLGINRINSTDTVKYRWSSHSILSCFAHSSKLKVNRLEENRRNKTGRKPAGIFAGSSRPPSSRCSSRKTILHGSEAEFSKASANFQPALHQAPGCLRSGPSNRIPGRNKTVAKSIFSKQFRPIPNLTSMNLVLIILILLILVGGGGGYYYGGPYIGGGIGSLVLLILIIWLLLGRRRL